MMGILGNHPHSWPAGSFSALRLGHSMLGPETAAGEDAENLEMSWVFDGFWSLMDILMDILMAFVPIVLYQVPSFAAALPPQQQETPSTIVRTPDKVNSIAAVIARTRNVTHTFFNQQSY